jgi:gamma-glutamyltranspeptidase
METGTILAIIGGLGGATGISTLLVTIFQRRKYKAEAETIDAANQTTIIHNQQEEMTYVTNQLIHLQEMYKTDMEELREANKRLQHKVDGLNKKLMTLMNWIVVDNHKYQTWLEERLKEYDPDIVFQEHMPPPDVFDEDDDDDEPSTNV